MAYNYTHIYDGQEQDMISSTKVMKRFGYSCRKAFWNTVKKQGIPHLRMNRRVIKFPAAALEDWIRDHTVAA